MAGPKNILLVEDDRHDQFFFIKALKNIENVVIQDIAEDGIAAIAKLESLPVLPDLIFMDINMPRMNGLECLEEISKHATYSQIPVVMLSTSTEELELTRSLGAKGFIKKSGNTDLLQQNLQGILDSAFADNNSTANNNFEPGSAGDIIG
ncbi:MAG TPA: response regulator [Chitinophagales bacterium]|nr:response regulator [Chitinophagales bacterium]